MPNIESKAAFIRTYAIDAGEVEILVDGEPDVLTFDIAESVVPHWMRMAEIAITDSRKVVIAHNNRRIIKLWLLSSRE